MKIPVPYIEQDNLLIRQYGLKDAPALYALMKENRPSLLHTFPQSVKGTQSLLKTRRYILEKHGDRRAGELLVCGVFEMPEEKLIGHVLFTKFEWSVPKCDMGYFIDKAYAGKGIATQVSKMMSKWGFEKLKLEKITLRIWPQNLASIKVAEKLGAHKVGLSKCDFRSYDGKLMDCMYYELYR